MTVEIKYLVAATVLFSMFCLFGYKLGEYAGYEQGKAEALSTSPVSEDLEATCAGLWVGEQNKKYWRQAK